MPKHAAELDSVRFLLFLNFKILACYGVDITVTELTFSVTE